MRPNSAVSWLPGHTVERLFLLGGDGCEDVGLGQSQACMSSSGECLSCSLFVD